MGEWLSKHWRAFWRSGPDNIYTFIWWAILTAMVASVTYIALVAISSLSYLFPHGSSVVALAEKWKERFLIAGIALAIPLIATLTARAIRSMRAWIRTRKQTQGRSNHVQHDVLKLAFAPKYFSKTTKRRRAILLPTFKFSQDALPFPSNNAEDGCCEYTHGLMAIGY
jgi:hypothetical protein